MDNSSTESLESILQRLAAYSQGNSTPNDEPNLEKSTATAADPFIQRHPQPKQFIANNAYENRLSQQEPVPQVGIADHLQRLQQITHAARANPQVNSSTFQNEASQLKAPILEWPSALRHVSRIGSQDPDFEEKIRKVSMHSSLVSFLLDVE
jgi:hypothetical protein